MKNVFIGIPTLNRPLLVRETIRSVLKQTYGRYKVFVSDNCSEEQASQSVQSFVEGLKDDRFCFYRQPQNAGEYGQGRFFFEEAQDYEYFMILHDDDVLNTDYLEKGLRQLELHTRLACFVANPFLMDGEGNISRDSSDRYLLDHGRKAHGNGEYDILSTHLHYGFTPLSGTLFRMEALKDSGFVDSDCFGNYPFECNIFLRLGERGAKGWYQAEELLGFRYHRESLRNYLKLMDNYHVVDTMIRLFSRRSFSGENEKRRKVVLSRLYRARSLILTRRGVTGDSRRDIVNALKENVFSFKAWSLSVLIMLVPGLLRRVLPKLPELREAPRLAADGGGE